MENKVWSAENQYTPGHIEGEYNLLADALKVAEKGAEKDGRLWWVESGGDKYTFTGKDVV
jgi:hypothetical protein